MLHKVGIHADTIFIRVQMHPVRLNVRHAVALLQKNNIAGDFRSGIGLERIVWKSDRANQVSPLCQVFADSGVFLVHSAL